MSRRAHPTPTPPQGPLLQRHQLEVKVPMGHREQRWCDRHGDHKGSLGFSTMAFICIKPFLPLRNFAALILVQREMPKPGLGQAASKDLFYGSETWALSQR